MYVYVYTHAHMYITHIYINFSVFSSPILFPLFFSLALYVYMYVYIYTYTYVYMYVCMYIFLVHDVCDMYIIILLRYLLITYILCVLILLDRHWHCIVYTRHVDIIRKFIVNTSVADKNHQYTHIVHKHIDKEERKRI